MGSGEEGYDWIEAVVKAAGLLGFNQVRLRWKLRAWQDRMRGKRAAAGSRVAALAREHKTCPACGGINNLDQKVCLHCGARLHSRPVDLSIRLFRHLGVGLTPESFLAASFIAVYAVSALMLPESNWMSMSGRDLVKIGGNFPSLTLRGQYWRLWTAVFIHAGLWHIGFNTIALLYLAPVARETYGAGRTMLAFLATGMGASMVSILWMMFSGRAGVSIGASGAISGLIGLMTVYGHREGTAAGISVRNFMARWMVYILVFGFFIGADNAAHLGGFFLGGMMALVLPAKKGARESAVWMAAGAASALAAAAAVGWILYLALSFPPG